MGKWWDLYSRVSCCKRARKAELTLLSSVLGAFLGSLADVPSDRAHGSKQRWRGILKEMRNSMSYVKVMDVAIFFSRLKMHVEALALKIYLGRYEQLPRIVSDLILSLAAGTYLGAPWTARPPYRMQGCTVHWDMKNAVKEQRIT